MREPGRVRGRAVVLCSLLAMSACAPSSDDPGPERTGRSAQVPVTSGWQTLAEMPTPRTEVAGAAAKAKIYVVGGFSEEGTVPTVEVYDVASDTWVPGADLPLGVNHAMATTRRGKPYVFGGYRGPGIAGPTRRAFVLRDGRWRSLPRMPYPVAAGAALTSGGKIYVVGGVKKLDRADGHVLSPKTLVYNAKKRSWVKRPPLPTLRQHLGGAALGGRLYVVGGRVQGLEDNLATFERFNPSNRNWRSLPDMPTARGGLAAAATESGLVVAVGGEEGAGTFEEVEAFDVAAGVWSSIEPLPTPRHGLAVVTIGNTLYAIGGGPQPGLTFSGANEAIDLDGL